MTPRAASRDDQLREAISTAVRSCAAAEVATCDHRGVPLAVLVVVAALASGGAIWQPTTVMPAAPRRVSVVDLNRMPVQLRHRGRLVAVRNPADPEIRGRGGSGGPMLEIDIAALGQARAVIWHVQAFGLAVVESATPWPAFEAWSGAGGGVYTRVIYTWDAVARAYCGARVDEFEDHGDEAARPDTVRIAGEGRIVRYARSRPFGCETP